MIKRVRGNTIHACVDLEKIEIVDSKKVVTDYILKPEDGVTVSLIGMKTYKFDKLSIIGKTISWTIPNNVAVGTYGLEVVIIIADGNGLRSYKKEQLQIVDSNEEAGIDSSAEFEADNIKLSTANFGPMVPQSSGDSSSSYDDTEVRNLITKINEQITLLQTNKAEKSDLPTNEKIADTVITYVDEHKDELKGEPGKPGEPGKDGITPKKGVDYYTEADKNEFKNYIDSQILGGRW